MKENRGGLTSDEKELLTKHTQNQQQMDFKMSLLAFASLLLVCALVVASSIIARSEGKSDPPNLEKASPRQQTVVSPDTRNSPRPHFQGTESKLTLPPRSSPKTR